MFILKHQEGDINYEFKKGGFSVKKGLLYLSIETTAVSKDSFPDCFYFAVDAHPVIEPLSNTKFDIATNPEDEPPNVYVYTTFHAVEVEAEVKVVSEVEIEVTVKVVSEDVNYYNEKAKPNTFHGKVILKKKPKSKLWLPM